MKHYCGFCDREIFGHQGTLCPTCEIAFSERLGAPRRRLGLTSPASLVAIIIIFITAFLLITKE